MESTGTKLFLSLEQIGTYINTLDYSNVILRLQIQLK
jgi:hypothetical protein